MNEKFLGLLCLLIVMSNAQCKLFDVNSISTFPVFEDQEFRMKFISDGEALPKGDAIVFRMMNQTKELQIAQINPGITPSSKVPISGLHFHIESYETDNNKDITVVLRFHRLSNLATLVLFYLPEASEERESHVVNNLDGHEKYFMTQIFVNLNLHWNTEMKITSTDGLSRGLHPGSKGLIKCHATGGSPKARVKLMGLEDFQIISLGYDELENSESATVIGRIEDHDKQIGCIINNEIVIKKMKIFHQPTQLLIEPELGDFVMNGSSIKCFVNTGYPQLTPKWKLELGPLVSVPAFDIDNDHGILHISSTAPKNTKWKFSCSIDNAITGSPIKQMRKFVEFTIGENPASFLFLVSAFFGVIFIVACTILFACIVKCRKSILRPSNDKNFV